MRVVTKMKPWVAILVAVVFGGVGIANIVMYAPTAVPNILKGLGGELLVSPILIVGMLVCLGLTLVAGILAFVFYKGKRSR